MTVTESRARPPSQSLPRVVVAGGGIAALEGVLALRLIAATIGVSIEPTPFHPVLRSQMLTGIFPRYLRLDASEPERTFSTQAPWWPTAKVVGRYITPFLSKHLGLGATAAPPAAADVDREIEVTPGGRWAPI